MSTHTQILYQIVFSTKNRDKTLITPFRTDLFNYMAGILISKKCHPYLVNGVEDHIHILTHVHPSVAVADMIKSIKLASSKFIKERSIFPHFKSWQDGYGAFTYSFDRKKILIDYIKNQEEHHKTKTFHEEYIELLNEQGVQYDPKYLF